MITASGIGSGLDVNGLVSQLVEAERAPKAFLFDRQEAQLQAQISGFGTLKSALLDLQRALGGFESAEDFRQRSATTSDDTLFTATATSSAVAGNYQVVVDQLAQPRKLSSQGFGSDQVTIGTGLLTISNGTESFTVDIDAAQSSVGGVRDAINSAADNDIVTATVIQVDDGGGGVETRLLLSATGAADLTISVDDADGNDANTTGLSQLVFESGGTENLQSVQTPSKARVFIDGLLVSSDTNQVADAIEGVTIDLVDADAAATATLSVSEDGFAIEQSMTAFADAYNDFIGTINTLTRVNSPEDAGILVGDATLRNVVSQIRREFSVQSGGFGVPGNLAELGFSTRDDGTLAFDAEQFDSAFAGNAEAVSDYFSAEHGLASRLGSLLDGFLAANGTLQARTDRLDGEIARISDSRERLNLRIQATERRLLAQFSAMDSLVAQLNATSSFLDQQLNTLSSITRRDDS